MVPAGVQNKLCWLAYVDDSVNLSKHVRAAKVTNAGEVLVSSNMGRDISSRAIAAAGG